MISRFEEEFVVFLLIKTIIIITYLIFSLILAVPIVFVWNYAANYLSIKEINAWEGVVFALMLLIASNMKDDKTNN